METLKPFILLILIFQTSLIFSEDLKCQGPFKSIKNQNSPAEIMREREKYSEDSLNDAFLSQI